MGFNRLVVDAHRGEPLHIRELQILRLGARGLTYRQMATELFLAETTVKTYSGRLFGKLGARNMAHAVALAYEGGLLGGEAQGP